MASASSITVETINRMTKEGRKLEYVLSVIQQPHRARACGSGAKSSADRRPVDPPPVVELRIFEGEGNEKTDITFSYNANFFLFATLEQARAIAHGRVQAAPQQPPVLTGMPVSGMAYLDRPNEAGYFIFPDLSVRHEGLYKLSFNLYEETKEEKDADMEPKSESNKPQVPGVGPESSFDWRLEVKSVPFTVYSAKKFPGLTESTLLSRTVAEQGCRVRIRRDVRMRRREEKGNGAYDEAEDYSRGRQMEDSYKRDASPSPISEGARQPHIADRRMSSDYHQAGPQGHSNYGREPQPQYTQPQYQAPSYQAPPPPPQFQQQASYGPPPPQHPAYGREFPQSAAPSHPPRERVYEEDYRRASASYGPPAAPLYPDSRGSNAYQHPPPPNVQGSLSLPPLRMPPPHEFKRDVPSSPMGQLSSISRLPQYTSPNSYDRSQDRPMHNYPTPAALAPSTPIENTRNGKRTYGSVFSASAARENEPLFNGMRPTNLQADVSPFDDDDDSMMVEQMKMSYKRADGSSCNRELPVLD